MTYSPFSMTAARGEAVHAEGGHDLDERLADVGGAHVGGAAGLLKSSLDDVHAVIGVGSELVGLHAVLLGVGLDEALGRSVLGVDGERSQEHDALGERGIEAGHGEDAVHAVHAEEGGLIAHGLGLAEDDGGGLIVDGEEHEVSASVLGGGELNGEVRGGGIGEGGLGDDLEGALGFGFLHEGVADALGVSVVVTIDNSDLRARHVLGDVVSRAGALVGVGEADLEDVVLIGGDVGGGSGRGQHEGAVSVRLVGNGQGSAGGGGADEDLHPLVHHGVVGVERLLAVSLIVLLEEGELDGGIAGVDLLDGELRAVDDGLAVDGGAAGQRAAGAEHEGLDFRAGLIAGAVRIRSAGGIGLLAAGCHGEDHSGCHKHGCKLLFHLVFSFSIKIVFSLFIQKSDPACLA